MWPDASLNFGSDLHTRPSYFPHTPDLLKWDSLFQRRPSLQGPLVTSSPPCCHMQCQPKRSQIVWHQTDNVNRPSIRQETPREVRCTYRTPPCGHHKYTKPVLAQACDPSSPSLVALTRAAHVASKSRPRVDRSKAAGFPMGPCFCGFKGSPENFFEKGCKGDAGPYQGYL